MKNLHLSVILLILFSSSAFSQTEIQTRDLESWSTVSLNKKYSDDVNFDFEQSFRLYDNSSKIDQFFTNVNLNQKWDSGLFCSGGLRFIGDRDKGDGDYDFHLRFNGDIGFQHSIDRFKFKYRIRLQSKNELGYAKDEGDFLRNAFRLKAGVKYNIKNWKFDPEFSGEIFRESGRYMLSSFHKYRLSFSTKYKFNKLIELKAFYRFERELGISYPQSTNIVGFNLVFNL